MCNSKQQKSKGLSLTIMLALIASVMITGGCYTSMETLKVGAVTNTKKGTTAVTGQVYYLPRAEHIITLERELTKCTTRPSHDALVLAWLREEASNLKDRSDSPADTKTKIYDLLGDSALQKCSSNIAAKLKLDEFKDGLDGSKRPADDFVEVVGVKVEVPLEVDLDISMRATVTPLFLPDMSHAYAIHYQPMRDAFKSTDYSVEKYPNGTLKSVNVSIDDQSGEAIVSSVTGLARLAALGGGFSFSPVISAAQAKMVAREPMSFAEWLKTGGQSKVQPDQLCKPDILLKLDQAKTLKAGSEQLAGEIRQATAVIAKTEREIGQAEAELAAAKKRLDALPVDHSGRTAVNKIIGDAAEKVAALEAVKASQLKDKAAIEVSYTKAEARRAKVRESLTVKSTIHFIPDNANAQQEIHGVPEVADAWFIEKELSKYCAHPDVSCYTLPTPPPPPPCVPCKEYPKMLRAWVAIYLAPSRPTVTAPPQGDHLVYREPARGILMVCREKECINSNGKITASPNNKIHLQDVDIPQLGVLASLPLKNAPFQNNNLTASFSESGSLTSLSYTSNARGVKAAKTFADSADLLMQYADARRNADKARLEAAKAEVDAETALLQAQLAREQARNALTDYRSGIVPDAPEEPNPDDPAPDDGQ